MLAVFLCCGDGLRVAHLEECGIFDRILDHAPLVYHFSGHTVAYVQRNAIVTVCQQVHVFKLEGVVEGAVLADSRALDLPLELDKFVGLPRAHEPGLSGPIINFV